MYYTFWDNYYNMPTLQGLETTSCILHMSSHSQWMIHAYGILWDSDCWQYSSMLPWTNTMLENRTVLMFENRANVFWQYINEIFCICSHWVIFLQFMILLICEHGKKWKSWQNTAHQVFHDGKTDVRQRYLCAIVEHMVWSGHEINRPLQNNSARHSEWRI